MSREVHALRKCSGEGFPHHTYCVDSVLTLGWTDGPEVKPRFRPGPVAVSAVNWVEGQFKTRVVGVKKQGDFLHWLYERCRKNTSTWMIGRGIYPQLVALGFFELVDNEVWSISAPVTWDADNNPHGRTKAWGGFVVIEDKTTIIVLSRVGGGVLHVVDSNNYGVDFADEWADDPAANADRLAVWWAEWMDWCQQAGAGTIKYTLGSQAMTYFRKSYLHYPIIVHDHKPALRLEESALIGGRCEAFRLGKIAGPVYHLDAHSLYGAMAKENVIPTILHCYGESGGVIADGERIGHVADVTVCTETPFVPIRDTERGVTIFPVGTFRTTLCGPELDLCQEKIVAVHAVASYELAPALATWAENMWHRRCLAGLAGRRVLHRQLKSMSQILYGKFAQRKRGWRHEPDEPPMEPWALWWSKDRETEKVEAWRSIAGRIERNIDDGWADQACPVITAWINSLARVWLWKRIKIAGPENVYYVDTDSLFVSQKGFDRLSRHEGLIGSGLGEMRIEGEYEELIVHGWKHYECDGRLVCAGLVQHSQPRFGTPEGPPPVEPVTTACGHGRPPIAEPAQLATTRNGVYKHGRVWSDGLVTPHVL